MASTNILSSSKSAIGSNINCYFLPKALVKLKLFRAEQLVNGTKKYSFRFEHSIIQTADTRHRYYLTYSASAWTDDTVAVEFTPEGFLKRVQTITEDKTGDILEKLGELGKQLAGVVAGLPEFTDRDMIPEMLVYEVTFDPFISTELEQVNTELSNFKSPHNPAFFPSVEVRLFEEQEAPAIGKAVSNLQNGYGIFAKPMASAEICFKAGKAAERHLFALPHPYKVHLIEITRPRFIKYSFAMEFENGFPKSINIQRPSQLLALVNIPIRVLGAIFSIPSKLIPFNINLDNTKVAAATTQAATAQISQQIDNQAQISTLTQQLQQMKNNPVGGGDTRGAEERSGSGSPRLNPNKKYLGSED